MRLLSRRQRHAELDEVGRRVEPVKPFLTYYYRGVVHLRGKKYAEAAEALGEALRLPSTRVERCDALVRYGEALVKLSRWENAIRPYQRALERCSPYYHYKSRLGLAVCCEHLGRLDEAEAHCLEASRLRPDSNVPRQLLKQIRQRKQEK
jgi:tetratricopeptide (TPR) repeat protein